MTDPNAPAFSNDPDWLLKAKGYGSGLTKREYFAAMAMQGAEASMVNRWPVPAKEVAEHAVILADALIAELNAQATPVKEAGE